jgi:uncharacterized protein with beta-barrel porin domain
LGSLAATANGRAAGAALDAARATASGDLRSVIREVGALSDPDVGGALAQLGGSAAATALRTGALDAEDVLRSISDRLVDRRTGIRSDLASSPSGAAPTDGHGMGVWFRATGGRLSGDVITSDLRLQGGLLGVDHTVAHGRWLVGAFGGYDRAALTLDTGVNGLRDRRYRAGAYATTTMGAGYIDAAVAGAVHQFETTRHVAFVAQLDPQLGGGPLFGGGIDRSSTARYDGRDVTGFIESGISRTVGPVLLQPFAGLDASRVSSDAFSEGGAGSIDFVASSAASASLRGAAGIRTARTLDAANGGVFAPRVEVRYLHELLDGTAMVPVAFAEAPTNPFTVTSAPYGAHAVAASAGFVFSLSRQLLLSANYRAVFASTDRRQAMTLGIAF